MYAMRGRDGNFKETGLHLSVLQDAHFEFASGDIIKIEYIPSAFAFIF